MKPTVYVPSRNRADDRLLRGPASQVSPDVDVVYVVGPDQLHDYAVAILDCDLRARILSCNLQPDIALVRAWIGENARKSGKDRFIIMDDDVDLLVRESPESWRLVKADPTDVDAMLEWMWKQLDETENVGISAREGNNRAGIGGVSDLTVFSTRPMRVQGFRTDAFLACEHGRVQVMEDFDISLQILAAGGSVCVNYYWAQGQKMTNAAGGCSDWRTHDIHESSAQRLAELHPGIVSLRQKINKGDQNGFGTRTEVTVQWKYAYSQGQKRRKTAK